MRRALLILAETIVIIVATLVPRCANWSEVFVDHEIYFADGDCYARMTRARLIWEHAEFIVRHHNFENFPAGISPHTTAPLDYLIVSLGLALRPFTARGFELAGAFVSPLLGVVTAIFLSIWMRNSNIRFRVAAILFFAFSPILVHATELGRPDHQSLLVLLVSIAICADQALRTRPSARWEITSGAAWAIAIWVSAYEPLILLGVGTAVDLFRRQRLVRSRLRWGIFTGVLVTAAIVEQRFPIFPMQRDPALARWLTGIGELHSVRITDPVWLQWFGLILIATPFLLWFGRSPRRLVEGTLVAMGVVIFTLTLWQARWAYFFAVVFALLLPGMLSVFRRRWVAVALFTISLYPLAGAWDAKLWPGEVESQRRAERQSENVDLRALAAELRAQGNNAFIAPWWLSPEIAYWSRRPGVGGSSHEAIPGTIATAEFYSATNIATAQQIASDHRARFLISYDAVRINEDSARVLGRAVERPTLADLMAQQPSRAASFLRPIYQNPAARLFTAGLFDENH